MVRRGIGRGAELGGLLRSAAPWIVLGIAGGALALGMRNRAVKQTVLSPVGRDFGRRLLAWVGAAALPAIRRLASEAANDGNSAAGVRDPQRGNTLEARDIERAPVVESESRAGVNVPVK
jgi:hypothetical protein